MAPTPWTTEEELWHELRDGEEYLMEIFYRGEKEWKEKFPPCYQALSESFKEAAFPPDVVKRGVGGVMCSGIRKMARKQGVHPRDIVEALVCITEPAELKKDIALIFKYGLSQESRRERIIKKIWKLVSCSSSQIGTRERVKIVWKAKKFLCY